MGVFLLPLPAKPDSAKNPELSRRESAAGLSFPGPG